MSVWKRLYLLQAATTSGCKFWNGRQKQVVQSNSYHAPLAEMTMFLRELSRRCIDDTCKGNRQGLHLPIHSFCKWSSPCVLMARNSALQMNPAVILTSLEIPQHTTLPETVCLVLQLQLTQYCICHNVLLISRLTTKQLVRPISTCSVQAMKMRKAIGAIEGTVQ